VTASVRTRGHARILVWGLGHVGTVTAACLAENGHDVTAVDPDPARVSAVDRGLSPVREPGLAELVASMTARRRMRAADSGETLVASSDFSIVCVGTGDDPGSGLSQVMRAAAEIGRGLRGPARPHVVILRSTVPPGTTRGAFSRALEEASGRGIGSDLGVVFCPEFLREGTALADFRDAPCVILGGTNDADLEAVGALFAPFTAAVRRSSAEEAELVKLAANAFHSLKVGFSNEIGSICARLGVDP